MLRHLLCVRSDLFARYCRYGDRMNFGITALLKPSQFAKFCKDAVAFSPSASAVDVSVTAPTSSSIAHGMMVMVVLPGEPLTG